MKNEIKTHIDPQDPSIESIRKYKNFDRINTPMVRVHRFEGLKKLFQKNTRFRVLALLAWLLFICWILDAFL